MTTTVSAPGKILLAGGYLVLEAPNVGLVIAVDKRFYTTVQQVVTVPNDDKTKSNDSNDSNNIAITVKSPQFGQEYKYSVDCGGNYKLTADPSNSSNTNEFVEKTLRVSLLYLLPQKTSNHIRELHLTIRADNDFYSLVPHLLEQQPNLTRSCQAQAHQLPRFLTAARDPTTGQVFKTGLGSSACLVTSLVGALCFALLPWDTTTPHQQQQQQQQRRIIYNLAQICHCHAQGKVGSGFDVSAACHGSHIYCRFPQETVADLLVSLDEQQRQDDNNDIEYLLQCLKQVVESTWTGGVVAPLTIPALLQVAMADVTGGSKSPSMARTVLAWKKKKQYGDDPSIPHWDDLKQTNRRIVDLLQQVSSLPTLNAADRKQLAECSPDEWKDGNHLYAHDVAKAGRLLFELRQSCLDSRRHLKAMGEAAGVPIEPDIQTALADATLQIPGVVAALVPGAGGYDALACLYVNHHPQVRTAIGDLWASWATPAKVCPLTVQAGSYGDGVRVETNFSA